METYREFWPEPRAVTEWLLWLDGLGQEGQLAEARGLKQLGHGPLVSFSPKVFIPLTRLCRDTCGYCAFSRPARPGERAFMTADEVLAVARAGAKAGCTEVLFTLGELPEQRYRTARMQLDGLNCKSTLDYLAKMAELVIRETRLLPHVNAGVMGREDLARLRCVSLSQGLMLEGTSPVLLERGGAHFGSTGKRPETRVATIAAAGELAIPFTTGILLGLGESRADRIESLLVIAALQARYGHIQEVIVQNFQPKPGTRMAKVPAPSMQELLWTAAAARLILGPRMNIQVPPNLSFEQFPQLLSAGINDWGGVSPVTADHVNPEAAWPAIARLREATEATGARLVKRLPAYPAYLSEAARWIDPSLQALALQSSDATGWARGEDWSPGLTNVSPSFIPSRDRRAVPGLERVLSKAERGARLEPSEIESLFEARGPDCDRIFEVADAVRARSCGQVVRYVVNRNINYTNVCSYKCGFCAFSKATKGAQSLRGRSYDVSLEEISRRAAEAWERGATEVCMQGGIHPSYTGRTYLDLLAAAKRGAPNIHVHAFSPLEVTHGAHTLGISIERFLGMLRDAGLGSLPGTAAEILSDEVRAVICPDKLSKAGWLSVVEAAHRIGLRTTSTIMFGHVDAPKHWSEHLLALRDLQERTGGITEFVPLPFVHMEAPLFFKGRTRKGPTFRETLLMHAVAKLVLTPLIPHIQVSWVKLGPEGVRAALKAGVSDIGGTLMNESISRAAGTQHGQELPPAAMDALICAAGRVPVQRTTLYGSAPDGQVARSYTAAALCPVETGEIRGRRASSVVGLGA